MIHRSYRIPLLFIAFSLGVSSFGQVIDLTGTVKDSLTQSGIKGANVSLKAFPSISTETDSLGKFTLTGTVAVLGGSSNNKIIDGPIIKNNSLCFWIDKNGSGVRVDIYAVSGKKVATFIEPGANRGDYKVNLAAALLADQLYFAHVTIGARVSLVKFVSMNRRALSSAWSRSITGTGVETAAMTGIAQAVDTLLITAMGHKTLRAPISAYTGSVAFSILADHPQGLAHVTSVSPNGIYRAAPAPLMPGFINSCAPDSLLITLQQIRLVNRDSIIDTASKSVYTVVAWTGSKKLMLTGKGDVDVGNIVLDSFPKCKITEIELWINDSATIWGKIDGIFNTDTTGTQFVSATKTFYTKTAYSYNAASNTGGADSSVGRYAAFESGPVEPGSISLQASTNGIAMVTTPTSYVYDTAGPAPSLTLVFDLSRMLRFYDGCNLQHEGGVNPKDPANRAYFFCHSVFSGSVAAFFGTPGQIQGYASMYTYTYPEGSSTVAGWMTIVCNPAGNILSGILIGNNDNDLTIAKGNITAVTGTNPFDFHYSISNVDVTGFTKCGSLGDSSVVSWHQIATPNGNPDRTGQATFTLRFKTN